MMETRPCNCTSVQSFKVKSAGARQETRPLAQMPFHTRTAGVEYQSAKLGRDNRHHNIGKSNTGAKTATCTVCGTRKLV